MYDPLKHRQEGMVPIRGYDLTDVDSIAYDNGVVPSYTHSSETMSRIPPPSSDSSGRSQFYVDLTQYGGYTTPEDSNSIYSATPQSSIAPRTPMHNPCNTVSNYNYKYTVQQMNLASPAPPTPIPKFQVFDLTCFIEDRPRVDSPISYHTPTQTYSYPQSSRYCSQPAVMEQAQEYAVVVRPHSNLPNVEEGQDEHSTIDVTDFTVTNAQTEVPSSIDMFAADFNHTNPSSDACDDQLFDSLHRVRKPADTGTVTPSVTKFDRDIRSCGTLPLKTSKTDGVFVGLPAKSIPDQTVTAVETTGTTELIDRREWMGNFVQELFDEDHTKAVFYASCITQANVAQSRGEELRKRGRLVADFERLKEYCDYVLQNLDLVDVLDNIDSGVYDDNLGDFQEDIELCLEEAMEKHDKYMEYENRKWKSKFQDDDQSVATRQRQQDMRLLAGEELLKQLDADFRMQLLDHFCHEIAKQQSKTKQKKKIKSGNQREQRRRRATGRRHRG